MQAQIGKYLVEAIAESVPGGFAGAARYTWEDGRSTRVSNFVFLKVFAMEREAEEHALKRLAAPVRDGIL